MPIHRCLPLFLAATLTAALTAALATAEPERALPAIKTVDIQPNAAAFRTGADRHQPHVLRSAEDAGKYFSEEALAKLKKAVDFDRQFVLVFAWRGSGQDKLDYQILESYPEQIRFLITPGRTRDLRPHTHVFALRKNVRWRVE